MHQHVWSRQQSKVSKPKLALAAEGNKSSILNGVCVTVSFQPFGTRVRHKLPRQPEGTAGTTTTFWWSHSELHTDSISSTANSSPPPPPLCLNSFTCSHFYDALILPPKLLVFFTGLTFTTNEDAASPSYGSRSSASVRGTWGQCQTYLAHVGHLLNKCIVTEKSSSGSSHRWGWRYSYTAEFYSTSLSVLFMTVTCWVEHGPCHGWHKSIHLQVKDSMLSRWGAPQVARLF